MERKSLILWLLMVGAFASAQVSFKAVPNKKTASVGERIQLSFIVTSSEKMTREHIVFPSFAGFQMLGRNMGETLNINNGKTTYQFMETVVLVPQKEGKIRVKGATVKVNGKKYQSNPVTFVISKAQPKPKNKGNEIVFMDIMLSKEEAYPNETVYAKVKLYARSFDALRRRSDIEVPGLSDFQVRKISANQERDFQQEVVNNKVYISEEIAEFQLTPKTTGDLVIAPFALRVAIPMDFFDEKVIAVRTPEKIIKVKELPANAPKNFSGAVGDFKFTTHVEDTEVKTNQSVNYDVELIGEGNLSSIILPKIKAPTELEVYPPKTRNAFQTSLFGEKGKLVDHYVIVPQYGGLFTIPPVKFCFFNPKEEAYKTIETKEVKLNVKGITKEQVAVKNQQKKVLDSIKKDTTEEDNILPNISEEISKIFDDEPEDEEIVTSDSKEKSGKNYGWYGLLLIPILGLLLWLIFGRKKKKNQQKKETLHTAFSTKEAKKKLHTDLEQLKNCAAQNQRDGFFSKSNELLNDVVVFLAKNQKNYEVEEGRKVLSDTKSDNFAHRWEELYNQTQMMKYGVVHDAMELTNQYAQHEALIKDLLK